MISLRMTLQAIVQLAIRMEMNCHLHSHSVTHVATKIFTIFLSGEHCQFLFPWLLIIWAVYYLSQFFTDSITHSVTSFLHDSFNLQEGTASVHSSLATPLMQRALVSIVIHSLTA